MHTHLNPETCVCVRKSTPPARQTTTTSTPSTCVCVGKSTPRARQTITTSTPSTYVCVGKFISSLRLKRPASSHQNFPLERPETVKVQPTVGLDTYLYVRSRYASNLNFNRWKQPKFLSEKPEMVKVLLDKSKTVNVVLEIQPAVESETYLSMSHTARAR